MTRSYHNEAIIDMKDAAVSQASRRFSIQITEDNALKKLLKRTEAKLEMSYVET